MTIGYRNDRRLAVLAELPDAGVERNPGFRFAQVLAVQHGKLPRLRRTSVVCRVAYRNAPDFATAARRR